MHHMFIYAVFGLVGPISNEQILQKVKESDDRDDSHPFLQKGEYGMALRYH